MADGQWYPFCTYDAQPSDDDDDDRLLIDTSGEDEDDSLSQSSGPKMSNGPLPLNFVTELSPERIKALAEATPTLDKFMKDMKIPPELDKLVKDASADWKKKNIKDGPENFIKAMNNVMSSPDFQKAIYEMELTPGLEKALDEMKQSRPSQVRNAKTPTARDTRFVPSGCEKTTKESSGVGDNPLLKLEDFVGKPFKSYFNAIPPDMTISTAPGNGNSGCETIPITGVSCSKSIPSVPTSSNAKSNTKLRSTTKRGGVQIPRLPQIGPAQGKSKLITSPHSSVSLLRVPPVQKPSKIDYVLNKLQNAAHDEQQMQELRRMSASTEIEEFKRFQAFIKERYKDVSVIPPSLNASERARMNCMLRDVVTVPPALTITPKSIAPKIDERGKKGVKSSCRRSPPPMVPIESFNNFKRPLNDDHVVLRLKRLGTDIELESSTMSSSMPSNSAMEYGSGCLTEEDDDDPMIPMSVDCILSTEPIVTIDETPDALPLKCFDFDPSTFKRNPARTGIPHPPPSLIPISSCCTTSATTMGNQFLPLLPSASRMTNTVVKPKRKPRTSFKSKLAKLAHALVQPAGTVKNNDIEIMNTLCQPGSFQNETVTMEREVEIFKIKDKSGQKIMKKQENPSQSSIETIVRRLKEKPIENKTVSESAVAKAEEDTAVPVEITMVVEAPLESQKHLAAVMNNVQLVGNNIEEPSDQLKISESSEAFNRHALIGNEETSVEKREETDLKELSASSGNSFQSSPLYAFDSDVAVITISLVNGRKLFTCSICSGVYCKMFSAKKHLFRNHINPRMVNEQDAQKFGLETNAKKSPAHEGFYRCNECNEIFIQKLDLKKHLLVHPVAANESFERSRKYAASYHCDNCDMNFVKKKLYYQHLSDCAKVSVSAPEPNDISISEPKDIPVREPVIALVQESKDVRNNQDNVEEFDEERKDALGISRMCLFCDLTFTSIVARKSHVLQHHPPKRRYQSCSYCKNKKFIDLKDLLKHICEAHSKRYFGCAICKIRFKTKGDLTAHNAESHATQEEVSLKAAASNEKVKQASTLVTKSKPASTLVTKSGKIYKCTKCLKTFPSDKELKRHRKKGHTVGKPASTVKAKCSAFTSDPYEQKYRTSSVVSTDYETEFYRSVTKNIRFNLDHCLDGKIADTEMPNDLKTITRRGLSHLKTRSSTSQYSHNERYSENELSFQDMYGAQNLNSQFIGNVSRLHLATQLALLQKANLLEKEPKIESASSTYLGSTTMAKELALTENENIEGPLLTEETENDKSLFSGEWTRPKKYICSTCFARFSNFWDMEDHRWVKHPNVWVSNYEFPADQAPGSNWAMERCLASTGTLNNAAENHTSDTSTSTRCTKCQKVITPIAEFHKHILECGGDLTWMSTMFASSSSKKHKKWKPYGSRRRKNIGRVRGLKRNIPTTPVKIIGLPKNRQKAGDTETIQKMIANLPPKRITRRIVQFDDIESKNQKSNSNNINNTLSESNILTRKRREKLDAKMNTQISRSFSTKSKGSNCRKKKQKEGATTVVLPKKSNKPPNSQVSIFTASEPLELQDQTSNVSPLVRDTNINVKEEIHFTGGNTSKEPKIKSISSPTVQNLGPLDIVKQEEEVPEIDMENMEPADSDSCLPDSSIILAAMRETMRQTDAVISPHTFTVTSKKRKRDDLKCKQESLEANESCLEPEKKRVAVASILCTDCKKPFTDGGSRTQVCEACSSKSGCTRSASLRPREHNNRLRELRNSRKPPIQLKSSSECTVEHADSDNSKTPSNIKPKKLMDSEKEDSALKNDVMVNTKSKKSVSKVVKCNTTSKTSKVPSSKNIGVSKTIRRSKSRLAAKNKVSKKATGDETSIKNLSDPLDQNVKVSETEKDKVDQFDRNDVPSNIGVVTKKAKSSRTEEVSQTPDSKTIEPNRNLKDPKSSVENEDGVESNIILCEVCQNPSIRSICDNCSSIARKNKVCVFCKRENTPKPYYLPICETCKDGRKATKIKTSPESGPIAKRELVEWTLCKVCLRTNHRVVCSSCVVMSQKHKICARCNIRWEDPQKTGMPVCLSCEKEWYPQTSGIYENVGKCTECTNFQSSEVTSHKLCSRCNITGPGKESCESKKNCDSNDGNNLIDSNEEGDTDKSVDAVVTVSTPAIETPSNTITSTGSTSSVVSMIPSTPSTITVSMPSSNVGSSSLSVLTTGSTMVTPVVNKNIPEETQANASPSKKNINIFLECKGCHGVYDRVSAYKLHCDTCSARLACIEEKKPLLGFVNSNTTVTPIDVNSAGPSFEILETVKMKPYPVNEGGKTDSHSINDVPVLGSLYDSDSSTSSKRLELGKSAKTKRSLATDESISETIESVIQTMCYNSVSEEGVPSNTETHLSSRRRSSDVTEISSTNLENFEKVRNLMETLLETSTTETESNTEILFPNEEETILVEPPKKKNLIAKKKKVLRRGPTTRSSLAKNETEESSEITTRTVKKCKVESNVSSAGDEELYTKYLSSESGTIATRLRRKPSDIPLLTDEETAADHVDTSAVVMRPRRKPPVEVTNRTLRSRSKPEIRDIVDDVEKREEDSIGVPNTSSKSRRSKESKRTDLVDQSAEKNEGKLPSSEEEDQVDKILDRKLKSELNDLGFTAGKVNKPARKGVKREFSESSLSLSKNELSESDRKVQKISCESDRMSTSNVPECISNSVDETSNNANVIERSTNVPMDGASNALVSECPLSTQNQSNFPSATVLSTIVPAYDESVASNKFSYDESMFLDGFEPSGAPSFDENQQDGVETSTWRPFLEVTSLGSILDSVNELLSRPEVVSSCVADTMSTQSVTDTQTDGLTSLSVNDCSKVKEDHSVEQEDESPTLMDLDHQTAHHSEKVRKESDETQLPSNGGQSIESIPVGSTDSKEEICEVCGQSYPDLKALKMHMSTVHYPNISTTRSAANGKLRSSTRTQQNGIKTRQKCSQCQKILVGKREMASHVDEHVTTFATNQGCDAVALRKGIAEKLEVLFYNNAFDNYMKSPQESSTRNNASLKTFSPLNTAKKNQFGAWKSAVNKRLKSDSSSTTVGSNETGESSSGSTSAVKPTKQPVKQTRKTSTNSTKVLNLKLRSDNASEEDRYPCPICPLSFKLTVLRNQHIIFMHAPRTSTHPPVMMNENSTKTLTKNNKNGPLETTGKSDGKVIRSYLLNESVNSCLEAKKEAVHKAIAESTARNVNELRKQVGRPTDTLATQSVADLQTTEGPPALEPAPSGEQILNNTDRSPPKLEASTGVPVPSVSAPSILRQNLTSSSTGSATSVSQRNGKPCRKKMSKKEIDLPPAVVKFKAEQALLELSINKFRKIRS